MAENKTTGKRREKPGDQQQPPPAGKPPDNNPVAEDPAVERGERIQTGKDIARGGKEKGKVPGATEQPVPD